MNDFLVFALSLTFSGSLLAAAVWALTGVLKNKLPKVFCYYLWLIVLVRLVLPFSFTDGAMQTLFYGDTGMVTVYEQRTQRETASSLQDAPQTESVTPSTANNAANADTAAPDVAPTEQAPAATKKDVMAFVNAYALPMWAAGAAISIAWFALSYALYSRKLLRGCLLPKRADMAVFRGMTEGARVRLLLSPSIKTPMLLGVLRPTVVLPMLAYSENEMQTELMNILTHELSHYRRRDILYKWVTIIVTSLHWFNPLMILVRHSIGHACELACDETVIQDMNTEQKQSYGNTLLAMASDKRLPSGVLLTTMCEEKKRLKERLKSIMEYKKKTVWTALVCVMLALLLTGCGAALGAATGKKQETKITENTQSISNVGGADAPTAILVTNDNTKIIDFDGDGKADSAVIQAFDTKYAMLTVTLGNGQTVEKRYDGWWWPVDAATGEAMTGGQAAAVQTADFDGNGRDDILLWLPYAGSSGDSSTVSVLRMEGGRLAGLSTEYAELDGKFGADMDFTGFGECGGAKTADINGKAALLTKHVNPNANDEAWYITSVWNGAGWAVQSVKTGTAAGWDNSGAPLEISVAATIPAVHREGFREADITIVDTPVSIPAGDADHDPAMAEAMLTEQIAQSALRQLYDMSGILIDKCYATGTARNVAFSLDGNDFNLKSFCTAYFDDKGNCVGLSMVCKKIGVDYSTIDPAAFVKPDNAETMSQAELALWYYKNSSYGDRRAVVEAKFDSSYYNCPVLLLENGDFIIVEFDETTGLPWNITGPVTPAAE